MLKNIKEEFSSFFKLERSEVFCFIIELFLDGLFIYSVLMISWYVANISFLFIAPISLNNSYLTFSSVIFVVIASCYFYFRPYGFYGVKKLQNEKKLVLTLEECVANITYVMSFVLSVLCIGLCLIFTRRDIISVIIGVPIIICPFVFYLSTHLIFYICRNNKLVIKENKLVFILKKNTKQIWFLLLFIIAQYIFVHIDLITQLIFDNTSLSLNDVGKIKRGLMRIDSYQIWGNILSLLILLFGWIMYNPSKITKN